MNDDGFVDFLGTVLAIAAFATLLVSIVAALFGAQQAATRNLKFVAMPCGCLSGLVVAVIVAFTLGASNFPLACLALAPILGGVTSFGMAWMVGNPPQADRDSLP